MRYAATALILNWRRQSNVAKILDALRCQSVNIEIFMWDNSGSERFKDSVDLHVSSSSNLVCAPRWYLAKWASAPVVFSLDDDLIPSHDQVVEQAIDALPKGGGVGYEGVILRDGKGYRGARHLRAHRSSNRCVDIIKGRFLMTHKSVATLSLGRGDYDMTQPKVEDDIVTSSCIEGRKVLPATLCRAFRDLDQGRHALCLEADHQARRDSATRRFFAQAEQPESKQ